MVKAAPTSSFIVTETDLLLELLIVALDAPAQLGAVDQPVEGDVLGQGREPIFGGISFLCGPLDEQPFLDAAFVRGGGITVCGSNTNAGEAGFEPVGRAFAPREGLPGLRRQAVGEIFDLDRRIGRLTPPPPPLGGAMFLAIVD